MTWAKPEEGMERNRQTKTGEREAAKPCNRSVVEDERPESPGPVVALEPLTESGTPKGWADLEER